MATTTMSISLPKALKDYIQKRVAEGDFSNASDYVRQLLREERKSRAEKRLEILLLEGLDSGEPEEATDDYWNDLIAETDTIVEARRKRKKRA
jgi:antitoxin ParD1/3/4